MKFFWRRAVAVDPINLVTVPVQKKEKRRPLDLEFLEDFFPDFIPPRRPVKDKVVL
jgi:hypothetical protein